VSDTLLCASGIMLLALLELVRRRSRGEQPAPTLHPEHHLHHL
jgi:hypothetical protein